MGCTEKKREDSDCLGEGRLTLLDGAKRSAWLLGLALANLGFSASGAVPGDPAILSAELAKNGTEIVIRTVNCTQILNPAKADIALAGYDAPIISDDHHAAAWIEEQGGEMSDASYPEPTGVWLFAQGRLVKAVGCDSGRPFEIRFSDDSRKLVLICDVAHGPKSTHEISFDTISGRCLFDLDKQDGKRQPCSE